MHKGVYGKANQLRVARWHFFKPKIPILEGLRMENVGTYILGSFGIIFGQLVIGNVVIIWYIFHRVGILCHENSGSLEAAAF
jgi:hypothetical protein